MAGPASSWSLRRRLMLIALITSAAAAAAGSVAMYVAAGREDDALFDMRLQELSHIVSSFAEDEIQEIKRDTSGSAVHTESLLHLGAHYQYQVWSDAGKLLMHSANAPPDVPLMPLNLTGFHDSGADAKRRRVFSEPGPQPSMTILVAEQVNSSGRVLATFSWLSFGLLVFLLAFVGLLNWWLLHHVLRSIESTSSQLRERTPEELAPVKDDNPPEEMVPVILALNQLFGRIECALAAQRRFTSVAAHEMRTPLAGLRAHAQVAARSRCQDERETALAAVMQGVDRTSHLLSQLLDLAHADALGGDHTAPGTRHATIGFEELFRQLVREVGADASQRGLRLECVFDAPCVQGEPFGLAVLLRNLVTNAIAYTPDGGRIVVCSSCKEACVTLSVDDTGPGIPFHERERVFERFYRSRTQAVDGVGLGLSIVHSVAMAHRATVQLLDSPLGGLRVMVNFPSSALSPLRVGTAVNSLPA
jgi:two-component system OmpR family sensor kinase/two-component system sensor histidine kinase QseC